MAIKLRWGAVDFKRRKGCFLFKSREETTRAIKFMHVLFPDVFVFLFISLTVVSSSFASGGSEEEDPAEGSASTGTPTAFIYTVDIDIFSPRYILSNTLETNISGGDVTGRIRYWTQQYVDSSLDKRNFLSLFTCSLDWITRMGVNTGIDFTSRENEYQGASELQTSSRRFQAYVNVPERSGFSLKQKMGFNRSEAGEKRQAENGWSGETFLNYKKTSGQGANFNCGLNHRFEKGVVSPFQQTSLNGLTGVDAGSLGRLTLDFSMNRRNKTYFVDLFDDWEERKERSDQVAFSAPVIRMTGNTDLSLNCSLSEGSVTYLLGSSNNQRTEAGVISFTADLTPVEFASFHFTGNRSLTSAEYATGDSAEINQNTLARALSGKLHLSVDRNLPVILHQNTRLVSISYDEAQKDEERDIFHSVSGMTIALENTKLDNCSLVMTSETDMLVYMSGARSSRNYDKNTYRLTASAGYSPFPDYRVAHNASASAAYTQYEYEENRNSAFLLRYLDNTVTRIFKKGSVSLSYRYETRESGSWVSSTGGKIEPVFRSSGLTELHTARLSIGRDPFPGLEIEGGGSARLREVHYTGAHAGIESFIDLDFDIEGTWLLSRGGSVYFSASKAVRQQMYGRWNFHLKLTIPF